MKSNVSRDDADVCTPNVSEAELVKHAQARPEAFGPLYELYYGKILGYIFRRTLDAGVAEELTSNTFFNAIRALPQYNHRGHFAAWLYRIATNEINVHWRTATHRRENNDRWQAELHRVWFVCSHASADEDAEERMRAFAELHSIVERLPEKYRVAISLRYFEGMPNAEIAEVLGKRLGTVKSLIHRGLRQIKRHYQLKLQEEGLLP